MENDDLVAHMRQYLGDRLREAQDAARCQGRPCPMASAPEDRLTLHVPVLKPFNLDLKYAGIEKKDERCRTADIHSLRHTFGTLWPAAESPHAPQWNSCAIATFA
jgi:hypothetical protein